MDKKLLALGAVGVAILGFFMLRSEPSSDGFGPSGGSGGGGGPAPQMPMILGGEFGGGDPAPAPVYNYNFPSPSFPEPDYAMMNEPVIIPDVIRLFQQPQMTKKSSGGGGSPVPSPVQIFADKISLTPENLETTKKAQELRKEKAPGWGVFRTDLMGSKGLVAHNERIESKKAAAIPKVFLFGG